MIAKLPAWAAYVLPFGLFLLLTTIESHLPLNLYPVFYAVKIASVGGVLFWRYHRPADARRGMATRAEAEQVLGFSRLRSTKAIIRPDLHGPHATPDRAR